MNSVGPVNKATKQSHHSLHRQFSLLFVEIEVGPIARAQMVDHLHNESIWAFPRSELWDAQFETASTPNLWLEKRILPCYWIWIPHERVVLFFALIKIKYEKYGSFKAYLIENIR